MIELLINNQKVDLSDDFDISITRSIADIKEPQSRSSDWSKTITIPGTKFNNKVLGHIFEIGNEIIGSQFNPNKKADAVVLLDGMVQIEGFIRLTEIVVNDSKDISYNATIHGQTADLFTSLENAKLSDLNFSEYNHTMNITNVIDSWDSQIIINSTLTPFEYGKGYVWMQPLPKQNVQNVDQWRVDDHIPALYVKTVVDKIFDGLGYTYTSDSFFNTDRFKRLILPYQFGAVAASGVTNRLFQAQFSGSTTLNGNDIFPFANDSTGGNFDNGGNYDNTTYEYTVPITAGYNFTLTLERVGSSGDIDIEFQVLVNGQIARIDYVPIADGDTVGIKTIQFVQLRSTQVVQFKYIQTISSSGVSSSQALTANCYVNNESKSNLLGYNNTIDFSQFFAGEYTQKELLLNLVKMFNLYIESTNTRELRIVPRDDFYDGDNVDWSDKLDYSQDTQIIPIGDLQSNPYVFTYKDSEDDENKRYKKEFDRVYGDMVVRIDNDFVKTEKKIDITFSPTLIEQSGTRFYSYIPKGDSNFRILYYGGVANTSAYYTYNINPTTANTTKYPLTLHIDDPDNMQFDLCFGIPLRPKVEIGFEYSNQQLVNEYYYKTITEISDKNSKIFKGYFRITPNDWHNLRFNNIYFFENQYWRLNKVENYNPLQDGVFKCEFLLATYYEPFERNTGAVGVGGYDGSGVQGNYFPTEGRGGFLGTQSGGVNIGDNQGDDDNISTGDGNNVQGSYNTILGGTNVAIPREFNNVSALRCTDFAVPEGDRVYVENYPIVGSWLAGGKITQIDDTDSPYSVLYDDGLIECDTSSGDVEVTLPSASGYTAKTYTIKKTSASNGVTISGTIDGASELLMDFNNISVTVESDGTQWVVVSNYEDVENVYWYVKNQTGSQIDKGTPVYASGTLGASGRIQITPMIADGSIPIRYFIGLAYEDIANGADGRVLRTGKIRKLNTSSFNDGDVLWVSATTAGELTNTQPTGGNLAIASAFVVYSDTTNGTLAVRATNVDENHAPILTNYALLNFANDLAAAAGGVNLGEIYHTNGTLKVRIL